MPHVSIARARGRWAAIAVLVLALAATAFAWWRERELARRAQIIRWQDAFAQLQPVLAPLLGANFEMFRDLAKTTLLREGISEASWNEFAETSEWRQRFPGLVELGYAELEAEKCTVRFLASQQPSPAHSPGFDLNGDATIREAVQRCADAGYSIPSREILLGSGSSAVRVVIGLLPLPIHPQRPGTPAENRANLKGFIFFALDQAKYLASLRPQLAGLPLNLRLLAPGETAPPRTPVQRAFSNTGASGEWRFVASMKSASAQVSAPQWIVLFGGSALSLLMFWLFSTQARLRYEAELAREAVLLRDTEITALNHDLEDRIAVRTAELCEALAEEKEHGKLKTNFISMVSHEIRTPLALILGSSEILSRYSDRLPEEKRRRQLETIDEAVHRMTALMEDVLLFSRAESGRLGFKPAALDVNEFCRRTAAELESATHRRCSIQLALAADGAGVRVDESLLRYILTNLLSNAVKYSRPGGEVLLEVEPDESEVLFRVRDEGVGIPEADRARLFTPFFRGKRSATIPGTGLGLVIVKRCVEQHSGTIDIQSAEGAGTTVTVRLPAYAPGRTELFVKPPDP